MAISLSHNIRMDVVPPPPSIIHHETNCQAPPPTPLLYNKKLNKSSPDYHNHHHHHKHKHSQQQQQQIKRQQRTIAIEQAYVHDVYSVIASNPNLQTSTTISPAVHSYVKQFLVDFEPGSILLDIGCSDGQYLNISPDHLVMVGLERCWQWFQHDNYKHSTDPKYVLMGSVLYLPFRDEFFDGILCCSVLHHLSTLERRIKALKEIARIMKIGGKILLTVTSGSHDTKDVQCQDVLLKVNNLQQSSSHFIRRQTKSDVDYQSYISSTTSSNEEANTNYDHSEPYNTNSPSSNSDLENCYSFFKKAIKRFSLASSLYPFKNSFESTLPSNILNLDDYPIELLNLDEDRISCHSSKSSSTDVDSALSSFNRSSGCISQTSSNTMFHNTTSILNAIKEHLMSWKAQFTNSIEQWQSFEFNDTFAMNNVNHKKDPLYDAKAETYHRFSLPISFWRTNTNSNGKPDTTNNMTKSKLAKNKIYASNGFHQKKMMLPLLNDDDDEKVHKDFRLDELLKQNINKKIQEQSCSNKEQIERDVVPNETSTNERPKRILLQKSHSFELQPNQTIIYHYKLLAYYSMPELSSLFALSDKKDPFQSLFFTQQQQQPEIVENNAQKEEKSKKTIFTFEQKEIDMANNNYLQTSSEYDSEPSPSPTNKMDNSETETESVITEIKPPKPMVVQKPKAIDANKFNKKLLRQRSFSADYPPETVKLQPDPPRRFSASPNMETHRYNKSDHIPHHQQVSMDSEESFVTIIPANRSNRESINYSDNTTDFELELEVEEDECTNNQMISPNEIYSYSSEEEEAYCESFENDQNTSNDTSISSVLEATIKSVSKSNSMDSNHDEITTISSMEEISKESSTSMESPPTTLHQYYHLFRNGELEQIIEEHVQNLHVIDSFYSECAMSWCVVAEKIQVWTI